MDGIKFLLILKLSLKGFIADLHGGGGVVLKQLNYPFLMLTIIFRSVDHIVKIAKTIPVGVVNFLIFMIQQTSRPSF